MIDQENIQAFPAISNRTKTANLVNDKENIRRATKMPLKNENVPIKRRSSARLAAKKNEIIEVKSFNKKATTIAGENSKIKGLSSVPRALGLKSTNNTTVTTTNSKVVVLSSQEKLQLQIQSYRDDLKLLRCQLLTENPNLLTLKNKCTEEVIPLEQATYLNELKPYEVHYFVEDALEGVMPSELLMESYSLAIFDYLREREIGLLSCLDANDLTVKMTPSEDNTANTSHVKKTMSSFIRNRNTPRPLAQDERITVRMRAMVANWLCEIHEEFNLNIETLFIAVGLVDLYLANKVLDLPKAKLQLIGATSLLIAAKYEEVYPIMPRDLANLSKCYSTVDLVECERNILQTLKFAVTIPVPITFLRRYSRLMVTNDMEHSLAKYFCELTMMDLKLACVEPSLRAAASLALARLLERMRQNSPASSGSTIAGADAMDVSMAGGDESNTLNIDVGSLIEEIWTSKIRFHSGYNADKLRPVIADLAILVDRQNRPSPLRAIYKKYGSTKYMSIASSPCLVNGFLTHIANNLSNSV